MKKYLLILMGVLTFFFFSDSTYALTLTDGTEVDEDNFIYYIYSQYPSYFDTYSYFSLYHFDEVGTYRILFSNSQLDYFSYSSNAYLNGSTFSIKFNSDFSYNSQTTWNNSTLSGMDIKYLKFSNFDIKYRDLGSTAFSSNITKQDLIDYFKVKQKYKITYYLNNEIYKEIEVEEGSSHDLLEYTPSKNYKFSGWTVENDLDLTNINSDINIYGTTTYVRPDMNYSENIDSRIHELSVSIIGKNVPVEFDFVYTIMDFLILLVIVFCIVAPFILVIKLLGGIL